MATSRRPRRRPLGWVLLVAFVVVPIVEIYVLIQVGQVIGAVVDGRAAGRSTASLGSWLIKREGGRAWRALRTALESGRMPADELADGALILIGGTLMLSPGFVLDVARRPADPAAHPSAVPTAARRRGVASPHAARLVGRPPARPGAGWPEPGPDAPRPGPGSQGPVVRGEVVDD